MRIAVSEKLIRILCTAVIASWLLPLMSCGLMIVGGRLMSFNEPIGIAVVAPSSLFYMFGAFLMIVLHLSVMTITASIVSIVITIPRVKNKEWSPVTIYLAAIAFLGHLSFLLFPHPPGENWLRAMGL